MLTKEKALKIATKQEAKQKKKKIAFLLKQLRRHCKEGKLQLTYHRCNYEFPDFDTTKKLLSSRGFNIKERFSSDEIVISWKEEKR